MRVYLMAFIIMIMTSKIIVNVFGLRQNRKEIKSLINYKGGINMSMNTRQAIYIENLYEGFYEKHYEELSKTSDDVEWIENEASRLAEIDLDNFEMEG
jgi:hypothetical protein